MPLDLSKRWKAYKEPWEAFAYAAGILFNTIKPGAPQDIRGRENAFAQWYKDLGHHFAAFEDTTSVPSLVASCHGVVLELGPATGNQLPRFTKLSIKHVYGIEPNIAFMDTLRTKITEVGYEDLYTPVPCGIEDKQALLALDIVDGSVDTVLSIQVLCSVADPAKAAKVIYQLLKSGGELIFWEHHGSSDWTTWTMQKVWNLVWPFAVGGCHLDRSIIDILLRVGDWEIVEMHGDEKPWVLMPRVWGKLRKVERESRR